MDNAKIKNAIKGIRNEFNAYLQSLYGKNAGNSLPSYDVSIIDIKDAVMGDEDITQLVITPDLTKSKEILEGIKKYNSKKSPPGYTAFKPAVEYLEDCAKGKKNPRREPSIAEFELVTVARPERYACTRHIGNKMHIISSPVIEFDGVNVNIYVCVISSDSEKWTNRNSFSLRAILVFAGWLAKKAQSHIGEACDVDALYELIEEARTQPRGTMLVFLENPKKEVKRLIGACFPLANESKFDIGITNIDGAVLLDTGGEIHAMGTILDGKASLDEDSSRGARYNSAIRYTHSADQKCLAVVISEDRYINYISDGKEI